MARTTAEWYQQFADLEARGRSPIFEGWARGILDDPSVLALIEQLPMPKRQPNLIFAVSRLLGAPVGPYRPWRDWLVENWAAVSAEAMIRMTQTNEPGRCAVILPALALIGGPLALIEVGASAGLCLVPERYSYEWTDADTYTDTDTARAVTRLDPDTATESAADTASARTVTRLDPASGSSRVLLRCTTTGKPPLPTRMPDIVWRAGIDLNPIDLDDAAGTTWLETMVWPEQHERRERLSAAIALTKADPPRLVRGDALAELPALVAQAPRDATVVVITSAAIVYLMPEPRAQFIELIASLGVRWISNEGAGIVPSVGAALGTQHPELLALGLDGRPLAWAGGHGQTLDWLAPTAEREAGKFS